MKCTRCDGTGYLNLNQDECSFDSNVYLPLTEARDAIDAVAAQKVLAEWSESEDHDMQICDCCGDGEYWHGVPGEHYSEDDPRGPDGPYASNGGLCACD